VVITGGAQRLGLAAALALRKDGYAVVVTYRKSRRSLNLLERNGVEVIQADFKDEQGVMRFASELRRRFHALRALIHNASEWLPEGGEEADSVVMQRMLNVHVVAPFLLNQELGELLSREGKFGRPADIIHMSDYVAGTGSKKHIAYAASKAALDNLTLSFASKFAPEVKVNGIAPALLMFKHGDDAAYREKALKKSLLGIAPGESEGVNAIRYILESKYLTGKIIALDGGRHLVQAS
jgi:dihydromonapterin reductase/dihydrofolate reductase